ncbi:MAG: N-acetyl sugar amidotransferase [Proteobacteria bacterium]|nr:N-acetyl sugar amidotransferase [Pseudomonadota bacterium]
MKKNYQVCSRCVMDTSAADITFDEQGVCNYCTSYLKMLSEIEVSAEELEKSRHEFHAMVKAHGNGKPYDCIVGVSGGVDSSYALYLAVQNGLRPLAVHLDNGWDSEYSQSNIENLVRGLGVDLHTHVIDWPENRDMQCALFKSGVIDIEMIMDNAQAATNYKQALKYGLKDILSGTNTRTEGMPQAPGWTHYKFDVKNIRAIQNKFGREKIKTHPLMSTLDWIYFEYIRKVMWHNYLDYFIYNKAEAIEILKNKFQYVPYRYKHGESVFTRFYQNYILPEKFGVDKRRVHHSTLICTGQMTRSSALDDLKGNPYIESGEAADDQIYVLKKLGMTKDEFCDYMLLPPVPHQNYPSEMNMLKILSRIYKAFKRQS